jgi:hypothetical protein
MLYITATVSSKSSNLLSKNAKINLLSALVTTVALIARFAVDSSAIYVVTKSSGKN